MDEQGREAQPVLRSFLEAVGDRVTPTAVSKPTLTELCHALEDLVITEDLAGTVIAGFQHARFWAVERDRYVAMTADPRRRAVVFTADEVVTAAADDAATSVSHLVLGEDHPLAREWFVVALNEAFSAVLFGRELTRSGEAADGRRLFLAVWSFDPQVVDQLLAVLSDALGDEVPGARSQLAAARGAHPPRHAAPGVGQRFTSAVMERLEAATQRALAAEAELHELRHGGVGDDLAGPDVATAAPAETRDQHAPAPAAVHATGTSPGTDEPPDHPSAAAPRPADDRSGADASAARVRDGRQALVIDEDAAMRGFLEALLRRAGWEVATAASVAEAVDVLQRTRCDVLLLDLPLRGPGEAALTELERIQPGIRQRTALLADDPPLTGRVNGRPVLVKPVTWSDLEAVLGTLTAAL